MSYQHKKISGGINSFYRWQSQVILAVQSQMVDEHLKLSETSTGKAFGMNIAKNMEDNYRQQLE